MLLRLPLTANSNKYMHISAYRSQQTQQRILLSHIKQEIKVLTFLQIKNRSKRKDSWDKRSKFPTISYLDNAHCHTDMKRPWLSELDSSNQKNIEIKTYTVSCSVSSTRYVPSRAEHLQNTENTTTIKCNCKVLWRRFLEARSTNMRQTDARFVLRNYKTSKANLPDTVAGSKLRTYSSVAESLVGWLTTGFPSVAIIRSPPSFPGSVSYCCLLRAILVNNSCKRVRPVYSPVTPRSIEFASARRFQETIISWKLRWTPFVGRLHRLDAYDPNIHGLTGKLKRLTPAPRTTHDPRSTDYPTEYSTDYPTDYPYGLPLRTILNNQSNIPFYGVEKYKKHTSCCTWNSRHFLFGRLDSVFFTFAPFSTGHPWTTEDR